MASQAIVWTDDGLTHWRVYASEGFNAFSWFRGLSGLCVYGNSQTKLRWTTMWSLNGWLHICAQEPTVRWFRRIWGCIWDHSFVGELPIRRRRMSRGVSYHRQCDCFSKAYSGWQHTKHKNYWSYVRTPRTKDQQLEKRFDVIVSWCRHIMLT